MVAQWLGHWTCDSTVGVLASQCYRLKGDEQPANSPTPFCGDWHTLPYMHTCQWLQSATLVSFDRTKENTFLYNLVQAEYSTPILTTSIE